MVEQIMKHCNNYFAMPNKAVSGSFEISNGMAAFDFLTEGQYYLIDGSVFNDGVHRYGYGDLEDETFYGIITPLKPPKVFLGLCSEIKSWIDKNGTKADVSPYNSESFGGYSYSRLTNSNGDIAGWKDVFRSELNEWRKI